MADPNTASTIVMHGNRAAMNAGGSAVEIKNTLVKAMTALWTKVAAFVPNLVGMIVILIVGLVVSKILQRICCAILKKIGFDRAARKIGVEGSLQRAGIILSASEIVSKLVFWLFMLTFLISAAETLGLENVSKTIDSFVSYLPNVIASAVIVIVGLMVGHFIRDLVRSAAEGVGVDYAKALGSIVYGVVIVVIASLAIGQLQIETALINRLLEITLLACGVALSLSLGLGTRDVAKDLVSGVYARDTFRPGMQISIGDDSGSIEEVGTVSTRIRSKKSAVIYLPNSQLINSVVYNQE